MNVEIEAIEKQIEEHFKVTHRYDEKLYNLGVEMGRLLEKQGIATHRPNVFAEFEDQQNAYTLKANEIERADKAIAFLLRNAVAEQVENFAPFCFDSNAYSSTCEKLDDAIAEKYGVQISNTSQREHGGSFQVEISAVGQVADILKNHSVGTHITAEVDNSSGDEEETIYRAENVDRIFYVSLPLNGHHTDLNAKQLASLADDLEKITAWLNLSLKNPR